jgi:hypothetical protein
MEMLKVKVDDAMLEASGDAAFLKWAQKEFASLALMHYDSEIARLNQTVNHWYTLYEGSLKRVFALEKKIADILNSIERAKLP